MDRKQVYELIDGERDYQNSKPPRPVTDGDTSVAEWLIYIEEQLRQAKFEVYHLNQIEALQYVRKIAALGVACMEHNDTPPRLIDGA